MLNILYPLHFFDEVNSAYNSQWVFFMTFHKKVLITVLFLIHKMLLCARVKGVHVFTSWTSQPYKLIDCFSIRWGHCLDFIEVESRNITSWPLGHSFKWRFFLNLVQSHGDVENFPSFAKERERDCLFWVKCFPQ